MTGETAAVSRETPTNDSERLIFAAVADDDTGASDLAGMLAGQGVRTLLVLDLPAPAQFAEYIKAEAARFAKVLKEAGAKVE